MMGSSSPRAPEYLWTAIFTWVLLRACQAEPWHGHGCWVTPTDMKGPFFQVMSAGSYVGQTKAGQYRG
eukprot:9260992-Pyramimonas_sp.AAC.2